MKVTMHVPPAHPRPGAEAPPSDAGLGLIEVIVALVVFGLIATGIIGAVTISLRMTPDNESREVAANLAAQEIDLVRAVGDPYQVSARTTTQTINGVAYTIVRTTGWLQPDGVAGSCGASTANFELKVNVDVSWTVQASTTRDIRSDTLLAPLSSLTTNSTGALAIYVVDSAGSPQSGVALTVKPSVNANGATNPTSQPGASGTDGCSYVGKLAAGNYDVTAKLTGSSGTQSVTKTNQAVGAGSTTPVQISIDGSGTLVPDEADNQDSAAVPPKDLVVSYLTNTGGIVATSSAASVVVQPNSSGYMAVAGKLGAAGGATTCAEFDPAAWGAGTSSGKALANGEREAARPLANAQSRKVGVPMGTVTLQNVNGLWVKAVQVAPQGSGNPGCSAVGTTIHFPQLTTDDAELALPYGTWQLFEGPLEIAELIPLSALQVVGTSNAAGDGVGLLGIVTLDPRPLS